MNEIQFSAFLRDLCELCVRSGRLACGVIVGSACVALVPGCAAPKAIDPGAIDRAHVPIQYGVGGSETAEFSAVEAWPRVQSLFTPPPESAKDERRSIRAAIALFEQVAGEQTPTHADKRKGENSLGERGQMDCVDESSNTTTYLWMMSHEGLLRFHAVEAPRWRTRFLCFGPHRTAVIRELATGQLWAVDSWVRDNGGRPDVQRIEAWRRREKAEEE